MGSVKKVAVIGWPVEQSLSPALHGYWLKQYNINGSYEAKAVAPQDLGDFIRSLKDSGYSGINVTVPHKENIIPLIDECDDSAQAVGAVNAITVTAGKLIGRNTDVYGFLENLRQSNTQYRKRHAVVLGAGGAARAVCKALEMDGFERITLCARNKKKSQGLAAYFPHKLMVSSWDKKEALLPDCDLLVNTTPLGMKGKEPLNLSLEGILGHAVVYDIVYNPLMTDLLTQAKTRGNGIIDGLGMLMHQAVPCFEAWFGIKPEVGAGLRQHLLERLA